MLGNVCVCVCVCVCTLVCVLPAPPVHPAVIGYLTFAGGANSWPFLMKQ